MSEVVEMEPWLTKREIAEYFGVSVRTWERKTQGLEPAEIFGRPRYRLSEVETWMQENGQFKRRRR